METNTNPENPESSAPAGDSTLDFSAFYTTAGQNAIQAAALQSLASALTLTLHNAVAEQQHGQILRMAFTSAAATAILDGKRAEAEEILTLAKSSLVSPDLSGIMNQIKIYLDTIAQQMQPSPVSGPEPAS